MNEPNRILSACVLAVGLWAASAAADPMDDYYRDCAGPLGWLEVMPGCEALAARLDALGLPDSAAWLARILARHVVDKDDAAFCSQLGRYLEVHPDHPQALYSQALSCVNDFDERNAQLLRALEIAPKLYEALHSMVFFAWYRGEIGVDPEALAGYRGVLYEVAKGRAAEAAAKLPPTSSSAMVWQDLFAVARYIVHEAVSVGDTRAAAAIRERVRRDAGLDSLDFGGNEPCAGWEDCPRGGRGDSLYLACQPLLLSIGLVDVCVSAVETLAGAAGLSGTAVPDDVLRTTESAAAELRSNACYVLIGVQRSTGPPGIRIFDGRCFGSATENPAVARLRAALEDHRGVWSSEHHRVHAQGFLGDEARLAGLRRALQVDSGNETARCNLAAALAARGRSGEAADVLGSGDPHCLENAENLGRGFTWVDRGE